MTKKNRVVFLDCARALCMLFIIGVYHMKGSYLRDPGLTPGLKLFIVPVLATFTAISAWFMGRKRLQSGADVWAFYRGRLLRAYPFYLLGCLTLYVVSLVVGKYFHGFRQLILTLLGLSAVIGPAPKTIWYMTMLWMFWLLTPLFTLRRKGTTADTLLRVAMMIVLLLAIWGLDRLGAKVDSRVYLYGIIYFAVLIFSDRIGMDEGIRPVGTLIAAALFVGAAFIPGASPILSMAKQLIQAVSGMLLILFIARLCAKVPALAKLLSWISYASMVAYLFHRQWLGVWLTLCGPFGIPLAALLVAALVSGSYLAQWLYDRYVVKFAH